MFFAFDIQFKLVIRFNNVDNTSFNKLVHQVVCTIIANTVGHSEALKEAKEAFDYVRRGKYMLESEKLENTELYRYFYNMYPESEKLVRELR